MMREITDTLGVTTEFDVDAEVDRRVSFLAGYLRSAAYRHTRWASAAAWIPLPPGCSLNRRVAGYEASFIAARLPYGLQLDEADAQQTVWSIQPDRLVTIDIKPAADAMMAQFEAEAPDIERTALPFKSPSPRCRAF